ncbi:hypothetical protein QWY93_14515 [Echinicola jeungdonensis]|uniref:Aminoglycoside phosphotransferase domain-containing protein n=1 Tax=Echinicola jeungdonensis TaxID=709343 RepID=A0ABV5J982_9BACT|nr:hypothetical protein [Echinicola jeungdonensis]MDN3670533.1 hypothetical protein [Echinicola jeungdonensis]
MESNEIKKLAKEGEFEGENINGLLVETHISWVILGQDYAFKIKKPFKLNFLDYSTLSLRKKFCELELLLNGRFSNIYLDVLPIYQNGGKWNIGKGEGNLRDYAVRMKRLDGNKRMDQLLETGKIKDFQIKELAKEIAQIHQNSPVIETPFELSKTKEFFNDIESIDVYLKKKFGNEYNGWIEKGIEWSNEFLEKNEKRFRERIKEGYQRDLHGDLHSGNIFLEEKPVIFDCIEFEEKFRQIDILYELAFLCMDLESFNEIDRAELFLSTYKSFYNPFKLEKDKELFFYYKCLRANIRAKVQVLGAVEKGVNQKSGEDKLWNKVKRYLNLLKRYLGEAGIDL